MPGSSRPACRQQKSSKPHTIVPSVPTKFGSCLRSAEVTFLLPKMLRLTLNRNPLCKAALCCLAVLVAAASVCPLAPAAASSAPDVHAIAQAVDNHYNHLRSLGAEFSQTYRGAGIERTESGTLWLKKPGKMRWEYHSPEQKLFLSDGKNAWLYLPADHQVRKTSVRKLDDLRSPLAFLLGKAHLEKELQGLSLAPDVPPLQPGDVVLRGAPKGLAGRVNQIMLEVTPEDYIRRIIVEGADGSQTEYRFRDQKENVEVSDTRFRFTPPPGVEVVTGELGQ
jgi:outer membrane lipoprotein carrier protein